MPSALVTGTSSGLGRGVATALSELGWHVLGTARTAVTDVPFEVAGLEVTDDEAVAELARSVEARWGSLDALVNNAGYGLTGPIEEMTSAELRHQFDVNAVAPMALARELLPCLRKASDGAVIVQMSSISGIWSSELFGAYCASKFALEALSEALAAEVADQGIRVVLVEPGAFRTRIGQKSPQVSAKGATGRYAELWAETDEWLQWLSRDSTAIDECVDAIVKAIVKDDTPPRLPVGEGMVDSVKERGQLLQDQADSAATFLQS